jgi:hypothetical protein
MLKGQARGSKTPAEFERLVAPHVASFDYFLDEGMKCAVELLEPLEVRVDGRRLTAQCQFVAMMCRSLVY